MRTVNEVVADVLANPEAYEHAFPVSAPVVEAGWSSYSRVPRGANVWPNVNMDEFIRALESSAEPTLREQVHAYWSDGETRFVQDESHPRDRVTMVNIPLRENSAFQRMVNRERERRGFIRRTWESARQPTVWEDEAREWAQHMTNLTAIDDPSMGTAQNYAGDGQTLPDTAQLASMQDSLNRSAETIRRHLEQAATPPQPDHYRVSPGRCHCGFTSMFDGDMDHHVRGIVHDCDGVPRRFWLCECGASAPCREVVRYRPDGHSPMGAGQGRDERTYLCDACCQRRGIR